MKHEDYFDITHVDGVTPEIIKEYKKLVRHERYLKEKDKKNKNYQYGYEEEIHHLLINSYNSDKYVSTVYEQLYDALEMLKRKNQLWYDAIMAYYSNNESSYSILAEKYGVSKQAVYLRVHNGLNFLRKIMVESDG